MTKKNNNKKNRITKIPFKMKVFVALSLALVVAAQGVDSEENPSIFSKMVANCLESNETMTCLSIKGITVLNRAARIAKLELLPGVSIRRYKCDFLLYFFFHR